MAQDAQQACAELFIDIRRLRNEALEVFEKLVLPGWGKSGHGYPETLYGYMTRIFSYVDLLSSYWRGSNNNQSARMVDFMEKYFGPDRRAHSIAVQVWRHKLMHTAQPRPLFDPNTGKRILWLLHWSEVHLPRNQHYVFQDTTDIAILNIGCIHLIDDLERATQSFLDELIASTNLQQTAARFADQLSSYKLRAI